MSAALAPCSEMAQSRLLDLRSDRSVLIADLQNSTFGRRRGLIGKGIDMGVSLSILFFSIFFPDYRSQYDRLMQVIAEFSTPCNHTYGVCLVLRAEEGPACSLVPFSIVAWRNTAAPKTGPTPAYEARDSRPVA